VLDGSDTSHAGPNLRAPNPDAPTKARSRTVWLLGVGLAALLVGLGAWTWWQTSQVGDTTFAQLEDYVAHQRGQITLGDDELAAIDARLHRGTDPGGNPTAYAADDDTGKCWQIAYRDGQPFGPLPAADDRCP
jgi:hypothetical protein